jgi:class 3 adenylate cyclase
MFTGGPAVAEEGYVGLDVDPAARIAAAGHGGQVLVSASTKELLSPQLPGGSTLRELGEYSLKAR